MKLIFFMLAVHWMHLYFLWLVKRNFLICDRFKHKKNEKRKKNGLELIAQPNEHKSAHI